MVSARHHVGDPAQFGGDHLVLLGAVDLGLSAPHGRPHPSHRLVEASSRIGFSR